MKCTRCSSSCIKSGKQQNGKQRYYCKKCCRYLQSSSKVISDIEMKLDEDNYYSIGKKGKELPTISIVKGNLPAYKKGVNDREREKE